MIILSGIQSSGRVHLGNYYGAIRQFVEFQSEEVALYFIANLHALNSVRNAEVMRELTQDVALSYLSLGLDPARLFGARVFGHLAQPGVAVALARRKLFE